MYKDGPGAGGGQAATNCFGAFLEGRDSLLAALSLTHAPARGAPSFLPTLPYLSIPRKGGPTISSAASESCPLPAGRSIRFVPDRLISHATRAEG